LVDAAAAGTVTAGFDSADDNAVGDVVAKTLITTAARAANNTHIVPTAIGITVVGPIMHVAINDVDVLVSAGADHGQIPRSVGCIPIKSGELNAVNDDIIGIDADEAEAGHRRTAGGEDWPHPIASGVPGSVHAIIIISCGITAGGDADVKTRVRPGHSALENETISGAMGIASGKSLHERMPLPRRRLGVTAAAIGASGIINVIGGCGRI